VDVDRAFDGLRIGRAGAVGFEAGPTDDLVVEFADEDWVAVRGGLDELPLAGD